MARRGLDPAQVVDAGCAIADAEGVPAVTLARVAAVLEVRTPSLYNHVAGLDGLLRGIALRGIAELTDTLRDATVGRSGDGALRAMADAYRGYVHAHPGRYAAGVRAPGAGDVEWAEAGAAAIEVIVAALRDFELDGDRAIHAVRGFRSAVHGFASLEAAGGFAIDVDLDASFEQLVSALAVGLLEPERQAGVARP